VSTLTIRWHDEDHLTVLVNGEPIGSASNDDVPGETTLPVPRIAAEVAEETARALGATVTIERPQQ